LGVKTSQKYDFGGLNKHLEPNFRNIQIAIIVIVIMIYCIHRHQQTKCFFKRCHIWCTFLC